MNNIYLIGMPGCGKSTLGKLSSKRFKLGFVDLDVYIEQSNGKSVNEIFKGGEESFRVKETEALDEISKKDKFIIATGGGIIKNEKNIDIMKKSGKIVFINRPLDQIKEDINVETRPLLKDNLDALDFLFKERYHLYKKYCDYRIISEKELKDTLNKLCRLIKYIYYQDFKLGDELVENISY